MPVTVLDLIVIGVMLISALLAMVRGFTREVLAIAAWIIAGFAGVYFHGYLVPYLAPHIKNVTMQNVVAGGVIFLVALIVVSFITARFSDMVLDSRIGAVDRTLGFVFGAARGLLLAIVAFLFFSFFVGEKSEPIWVQTAKTKQVLKSGGDWLLSILPKDLQGTIVDQMKANNFLPADSATGQDVDPNAAAPSTPPPQTQPATPAPAAPAQ